MRQRSTRAQPASAVGRRASPLAGLLLSALVAACTQPTAYQERGPDGMGPRHGFYEQQLAENRYRVVVTGNEATSRETVENYLLFRSAELARDRGYEGFRIVERDVEPTTRYITTYGGMGRPLGYAFLPGPLYNPGYLGGPRDVYQLPRTRYRASAEILLLERLAAALEPESYVAYDLLTRLAPAINHPDSLAD